MYTKTNLVILFMILSTPISIVIIILFSTYNGIDFRDKN